MGCVIFYRSLPIILHRCGFCCVLTHTSIQCNVWKRKSQFRCLIAADGTDQARCCIRSCFISTFTGHILITSRKIIYNQCRCFCDSIDQKWRIGVFFLHTCHPDSIQCHIFQSNSNNVADRITDDTAINQCTRTILCCVVCSVWFFY